MVKSKSLKNSAKGLIRSASKSVKSELPSINNNLKNASNMVKTTTKKSLPVIEKGVGAVYGTMATGFNLGIKGAKNIASGVKRATTKRRSKRSRKNRRKH